VEAWLKHHIPFEYSGLFPVFNIVSLTKDKALVSEITNNSMADCDRMFIPEFLELLAYAEQRFRSMYVQTNGYVPLGSPGTI
jgi:hypothetical protein